VQVFEKTALKTVHSGACMVVILMVPPFLYCSFLVIWTKMSIQSFSLQMLFIATLHQARVGASTRALQGRREEMPDHLI
jgi:hypothetical protein